MYGIYAIDFICTFVTDGRFCTGKSIKTTPVQFQFTRTLTNQPHFVFFFSPPGFHCTLKLSAAFIILDYPSEFNPNFFGLNRQDLRNLARRNVWVLERTIKVNFKKEGKKHKYTNLHRNADPTNFQCSSLFSSILSTFIGHFLPLILMH